MHNTWKQNSESVLTQSVFQESVRLMILTRMISKTQSTMIFLRRSSLSFVLPFLTQESLFPPVRHRSPEKEFSALVFLRSAEHPLPALADMLYLKNRKIILPSLTATIPVLWMRSSDGLWILDIFQASVRHVTEKAALVTAL